MVQKAALLKGKNIALTCPTGQAQEAGKLIVEMGGVPYYIPAIEIKGLSNFTPIKEFIAELQEGQVDYVILMSTNGVKYLFEAAETLNIAGKLQEGLAKTFMIAVGPSTAEALAMFRVRVDMVPTKYSSEGIIESLKDKKLSGKKIRIPRTSNANPVLTDKLREMGAEVNEIYVYESGLPTDEKLKTKFYNDLTSGRIDAIIFGSGLSAKNIFKMLNEKASMDALRALIQENITTVAIGPTTAEALKEMNIPVDVMPKDYLFEEALAALVIFWANQQKQFHR